VLLTDAQGVIVHATHDPNAAAQPVLSRTARVGVNIAERMVGTTAPGIVACTGQPVTVNGAEHFFDVLHGMHCAAAPIRDVHGQLAAVLDVSVEARPFAFGAAQLVALFATTIENRLLVAQSQDRLLLRFQASPALLGTPLEALAGIGPDGCLAWLNGAAERLIGPLDDEAPRSVAHVFGMDLQSLLCLSRGDAAQPVRLANGLGVWLQARLQARDGVDFHHAVALSCAGDPAAHPQAAPAADRGEASPDIAPDASLSGHSRKLIEDTLAAHGGNISQAARQLRVSRGTLYRRLRRLDPPFGGPG